MSKAKRHVHKYHNVDTAFGKVWACALPDCNHYMPQHMTALLLGKRSLCWECGEPLLLDDKNMKEDQPRCDDCRTGVVKETQAEIDERMRKLRELIQ